MLKKIGIAAAVVIAAVLVLAAFQPDTFRIERKASINATPERIAPLLSDFHQWPSWSPWEKLDPNMQRTYGGAPSGVGATYAWTGNKDVGAGRMEVTEATPSKVALKLDFLTPFEAHNVTEFALTPRGSATDVSWVMSGPNSYIGKIMCLFVSMDRMVGKDFEAGLTNLKRVAEQTPTPAPTPAPAG